MRQAEQRCTDLYAQMIDAKKDTLDKTSNLHTKHEESQHVITRQLSTIDELNKTVSELKLANSQIEFGW